MRIWCSVTVYTSGASYMCRRKAFLFKRAQVLQHGPGRRRALENHALFLGGRSALPSEDLKVGLSETILSLFLQIGRTRCEATVTGYPSSLSWLGCGLSTIWSGLQAPTWGVGWPSAPRA